MTGFLTQMRVPAAIAIELLFTPQRE